MSWLRKIAGRDLLKEIRLRGWSEDQLKTDGYDIWRKDNSFFVSSGDWAKIPPYDIAKAIEHLYPGCEVECEAECGPQDDSWDKIF